MKAVEVVLDEDLVESLDRLARTLGKSRSGLIRDFLRAQLRRVINAEADERLRLAYLAQPERRLEVHGGTGPIEAWEQEDWSDIWGPAKSGGSGSKS